MGQKYIAELYNILLQWACSDSWVGTHNTDARNGFHSKLQQLFLPHI